MPSGQSVFQPAASVGLLLAFLLASCERLTWADVPNVSVAGVAFSDRDLDVVQLGGTVTWTPPDDLSTVDEYVVMLSPNALGTGATLTVDAGVPVGTNLAVLPPDQAQGSFTHIVVFTKNADGMQTTPESVLLSDIAVLVTAMSFSDQDLDALEIGGTLGWDGPSDQAELDAIDYYSVWLAYDTAGSGRQQIGINVASNESSLGENIALGFSSHFVIYAGSTVAMQSSPAGSLALVDISSSVSQVHLVDKDLDSGELGGNITWLAPADVTETHAYNVYWTDGLGGRSLISSVAVGTNVVGLPCDTTKNAVGISVYTSSALYEQTTPATVHIIVDRQSSVSNVAFVDKDLDAGELGGYVTWVLPPSMSQVIGYSVYMAPSQHGASRVPLIDFVPIASTLPNISENTARGSNDWILVYTHSSECEQTTPQGTIITDNVGLVSDLEFNDKDLDAEEVGGHVTWSSPADVAQVIEYDLYLAEDDSGAGREVLSTVAVGAAEFEIPVDTPRGAAALTHVLVYSTSSFVSSTTPAAVLYEDMDASVSNIEFTDLDLDASELGGTATWSAPTYTSEVNSFRVYVSATAAGAPIRSQVAGDVQVGTDSISVPYETSADDYLVVYTVSDLAEQTTPASLAVTDTDESVSGISFIDIDLDDAEIGGDIAWSPPADVTLVTEYATYLARDGFSATGRVPVGTVAVGSNTVYLNPETPIGLHTHVVVYTKSAGAEQTTPKEAAISDNHASIASLEFTDLDLDAGEIANNIDGFMWTPPANTIGLTHYAVYLLSDTGATGPQLGSNVAVGTNSLIVLLDTSTQGYSHVGIRCAAGAVEQTTPAIITALPDTDGSVLDLTFGDLDFDAGEIGGAVTWRPPADASQVTEYKMSLAEDALGTAASGTEQRAVGTNEILMPVDTPFGPPSNSLTHIVVYTSSSIGWQTTPASITVSDAPQINTPTRWTISNAVATVPVASGLDLSLQASAEWRVSEAMFYSDADCSTQVSGISEFVASGQWGKYHGASYAFDAASVDYWIDTYWRSQCSPCTAFEAYLGVVVTDVVRCVKWLQGSVAGGHGAAAVAFQVGGVEIFRAANLRGERWEGMRYSAVGGGWEAVL